MNSISATAENSAEGRKPEAASPTLVRGLGLLDSVLLLVGGIIGSSIFLTAKDIAGALPHPVLFLLVWFVGGGISLCACFAFAELGSMFPDSGGQYVYLREAYGDLTAFLYGWMLFSVGNGGSIAALAVGTAAYVGALIPSISQEHLVLSLAGIVVTRAHLVALILITVVTAVNVVGLRQGTILQNIATWAKFVAMAAFVILGFAIGKGDWHHFTTPHGWVYITWVAGEVKEPRRNVPLAMVLGVLIVGVVYVAMNMTYLYALPLSDVAQHETIAQAAAAVLFSPAAATWLSALIAVSVFGALACAILSCARVYYAMALDGAFFPQMARVHPKYRTPAVALIGQSAWAAVLTLSGRYDQLYTYVIFGMVLFYTLTVIGMFLLRWKRPEIPRPYRCTGYPWLPALYILVGAAWTLNTIITRPIEAFWGTAIVLVGVPGYLYWKRSSRRAAAVE